jgi:hypothetical protein
MRRCQATTWDALLDRSGCQSPCIGIQLASITGEKEMRFHADLHVQCTPKPRASLFDFGRATQMSDGSRCVNAPESIVRSNLLRNH